MFTEFVRCYGNHAVNVLRLLALVSRSTVSPQYAVRTRAVMTTVDDVIHDLTSKFCGLIKDSPSSTGTGLKKSGGGGGGGGVGGEGRSAEELSLAVDTSARKIKREDLRRAFHVVDRPDSFGPLLRLEYEKQSLWLCREHFRQMRVISADLRQPDEEGEEGGKRGEGKRMYVESKL